MKNLTRREFIGASAALAAAGLMPISGNAQGDSTLSRIRQTKTLKLGVVAGGEPNYHKDSATGQWSGILIDFADDLAGSLNAKLALSETTWGNAIMDLQSNKIDLFLGLNPTPQRQAVIDFTTPLYNNVFSLITTENFRGKTWDDLNKPDVTIAVDVGSSYDNLITHICPNARIQRFETSNAATLAVQTKRADVQPLVITLAAGIIKKNPSVGKLVVPEPFKQTSSCAGVRKEADKEWLNYLNGWLANLHKSDVTRQIVLSNLDRLMGVKPSDIPSIVTF
ncbi:transporter substrate-binding domain-containing protein [Paraburkholderia susongensis]|uniref:Amino acid ABC transporter substrate-binding protein, PAAT family n=1 Tax=Paraburkholderia susongensis TaxID=1515439 RepID=A0A1X7LR14_9BURK|nr:transporter substrate-binding domain-containing protein [Paraburkholderia susongensis]SMG55569.1 amino acid ABC transporter substrate-binding protein, PAAT family [Paraburkholderia susongensis]